jgi:hypothetical protein
MEGRKNSPKREAGPKKAVVPLSPMGFEKHDDVVPASQPHDPVLLNFEALEVRVHRMDKPVHIPRNQSKAPGAKPGESVGRNRARAVLWWWGGAENRAEWS